MSGSPQRRARIRLIRPAHWTSATARIAATAATSATAPEAQTLAFKSPGRAMAIGKPSTTMAVNNVRTMRGPEPSRSRMIQPWPANAALRAVCFASCMALTIA